MKDNIECKACNTNFKSIISLIGHITNKKYHNMHIKKYYDLYVKKENEDCCENPTCENKTKFHSFTKGYRRFCGYKCSANSVKKEHIITKKQKKQHSKFMKELWKNDKCPYKKDLVIEIKSQKMKEHWKDLDSKLNSKNRHDMISYKQKETWSNVEYKQMMSKKMKINRQDKNSIYNQKEYILKHKESYTNKVKKEISQKVKKAWNDDSNQLGGVEWRHKRKQYMINGGAAHCNQFITNPSKPQVELFRLCQEVLPYPILNYPCGRYSIDIAVPALDLAIEYDGSYWHPDEKYDAYRQEEIEKEGWMFLRYVDEVPTLKKLTQNINMALEDFKNGDKKVPEQNSGSTGDQKE